MTRPSFQSESARYLEGVYLPRLARALEILPASDLEWRPHPEVISFGTILLHLEGNVRQWILAGLGEHEDQRDRASEFSGEREDGGAQQLFAALEATVHEAATLIAALEDSDLDRRHVFQGTSLTAREAVYHVVEHFSWHTGQAVWIAKARAGAGHGISFYDQKAVNRARTE